MGSPGDHRMIPNEDGPHPPECRACHKLPFTMMVRVSVDVHPDGCILTCDECGDFVIEVCDTITLLDDPDWSKYGRMADGTGD